MTDTAALGWISCPATSAPAPADFDAPVWSRRLYPDNAYGPEIEQRYGVRSGTLRAPMVLTIRVAGKRHACQGLCGHLIQRGQLHGAEMITPEITGSRRFCVCCVTTEKPESEFTPRSAAA